MNEKWPCQPPIYIKASTYIYIFFLIFNQSITGWSERCHTLFPDFRYLSRQCLQEIKRVLSLTTSIITFIKSPKMGYVEPFDGVLQHGCSLAPAYETITHNALIREICIHLMMYTHLK